VDDQSRTEPRTGPTGGEAPDPAHQVFLSYIDRSREYYAAKGFPIPYRWATNTKAPFTPLSKPLGQSRLGVVTTSFVNDPATSTQGSAAKTVEAVPLEPIPDRMFTADVFWHKKATHTDDVESFLPLQTLTALAD